jgi:hypothetical protein
VYPASVPLALQACERIDRSLFGMSRFGNGKITTSLSATFVVERATRTVVKSVPI